MIVTTKSVRKRPSMKAPEPVGSAEPDGGGMLLGYARVSKGDEQNNTLQAKALRAAGAMIRERTSAGLAVARAEGRVGGRRKKLDAAKRREIAESVITGRKSGADMARLYNVSQPTVSRIVAAHRILTA